MKKALRLLLLLTAISSYAQINYKPGYFIANDGKRTDCLIKDIGWKNNPTSFEYKLTDAAPAESGTINNITEFEVADTKYERYIVKIDRSESQIDRLSNNRDPEFIQETLYLKVLVSGTASLYEYEEGALTRFFYGKGVTVNQLIYKNYKEGTGVAVNNEFRGQLYQLMRDKITDPDSFKNMKYDADALIKLFLKYNDDGTSTTKVHTSASNSSEFHLKVTAGASNASVSIHVDDDNQSAIDFKDKVLFRIGLETEFILPVNNKKWALFADPNFYQYRNSGTSERPFINEVKNWKISFNYLEIPVGLRYYMHLNKNTKVFVNAAYLTSVKLGGGQVSYKYLNSYSNGYTVAKTSSTSSFAAGAGVLYKFISAEARTNFNHDILTSYPMWHAKYVSASIIIGIRLL